MPGEIGDREWARRSALHTQETVERLAGRETVVVPVCPGDRGSRFLLGDPRQHALPRQGVFARKHVLGAVWQAGQVITDDVAHESHEYQVR